MTVPKFTKAFLVKGRSRNSTFAILSEKIKISLSRPLVLEMCQLLRGVSPCFKTFIILNNRKHYIAESGFSESIYIRISCGRVWLSLTARCFVKRQKVWRPCQPILSNDTPYLEHLNKKLQATCPEYTSFLS